MSVSPPTQTANAGTQAAPLLEVDDLQTTFLVGEGQTVRAVARLCGVDEKTVRAWAQLPVMREPPTGMAGIRH